MFVYKDFKTDTEEQCRANINSITEDPMLNELNQDGIISAAKQVANMDTEIHGSRPFFKLFIFLVSVPFFIYVRNNQNRYMKKAQKKFPELFV